jgi:SagB-type dehydrogenase family enzyme
LLQGGDAELNFRTVPSGGGLYPIDMYVVVLNVVGLREGIYHYIPRSDSLSEIGDSAEVQAVLQGFAVSEEIISLSRACAIFLLIGQPWRSMRKYGNRGMRFMFMEAGAIAEHLNLAAVALGLGSVDCSSYYDDEVNEALGLDGVYQTIIHSLLVGSPG